MAAETRIFNDTDESGESVDLPRITFIDDEMCDASSASSGNQHLAQQQEETLLRLSVEVRFESTGYIRVREARNITRPRSGRTGASARVQLKCPLQTATPVATASTVSQRQQQ